jgi:hypothetical protein
VLDQLDVPSMAWGTAPARIVIAFTKGPTTG